MLEGGVCLIYCFLDKTLFSERYSVTHLGDRNGADLELLPRRNHLQLHPRLEGVLRQVYMVLTQKSQDF